MKIKLSNKSVHDFCQPYIIAEIGANHGGDMALAKKMISAAKMCGCDAVKFQSWNTESLIAKEEYDRNTKYNDSPKKHFGSLYEMVEKYFLRPHQHSELKDYCQSVGITFSSTPFSNEEVDLLIGLDVEYLKVASMDINNVELLKYMAKFNKPVVLSTGMATLSEIEKAVRVIEEQGNQKIILLHCISLYPPKYQDINLNNIVTLRTTFGYPVGFSDHTRGYSISLAAVALGACVIEKHFTLDKTLPGWDHEISANPEEMKIIVDESKHVYEAMGKFQRVISIDEENKKKKARRSLVANKDLKKGSTISWSDLVYKRPGTGIRPDEAFDVVGKALRHDIGKDELIHLKDLV